MRVKAAASHRLRQSEDDCKGRRQGIGLQGRCSGGLDYAQNCHFWVRAGANLQRKGLARVGGSRDTSRFDAAAALRITGAMETAQPKLRGAILLGSKGLYLLAMSRPALARVQLPEYLTETGIGWHTRYLVLAAKSW